MFSKFQMLDGMLNVYANPPQSPDECVFAKTTECLSSDLERRITPCQLGGNPDCSNCGCIASAGLEAIGRHKLKGVLPVGKIFTASLQVGNAVRWMREGTAGSASPARRRCSPPRRRGAHADVRTARRGSRAPAPAPRPRCGRMFSSPTWRWNSARSISADGCGSAPHSSSVRPDACSASAKS